MSDSFQPISATMREEEKIMSKKIIHVVAAAVTRKDGKYFCAQGQGKSLGGFWEFPGGRIRGRESPEQALIREKYREEELYSEIGIPFV